MVMITGSKLEEGPPFSGYVIIPSILANNLSQDNFNSLLSGLGDYITTYDVSGGLTGIEGYLPSWKNWGLMMRWICALNNWESFREINESIRGKLVQDWINHFLKISKRFPEIDLFCGGEIQKGAVGDRNTILSFRFINKNKPMGIKELRNIYTWLNMKMSTRLPGNLEAKIDSSDRKSLDYLFLVGQPVALKNFAVLRFAIGAGLICSLNDHGAAKAYHNDKQLLTKLSFLVRYYDEIVDNANSK